MKFRGWLAPVALALVVALAGCSRSDPRMIVRAPADAGENTNAAAGGPSNLEISADPGGALAYTQATLQAAAGQPISVAFTNPDSSGQPHNWVLVEPGQEEAVAAAAAPNQGNVPQGTAGAITAGAILQPGNSETIATDQPLEAGEYSYICTFPGHYAAGMRGTLSVGEATAGGEGGADAAGAPPAGEAASGEGGGGGNLGVAADPGGTLAYQQASLTVAAGQEGTVRFENPASTGQPHNWVLVEPGQEEAVATAALTQTGDPTGIEGILAAGAILQPGNAEDIPLPALEAGEYTYICTFPGHYAGGMRGTLTVE